MPSHRSDRGGTNSGYYSAHSLHGSVETKTFTQIPQVLLRQVVQNAPFASNLCAVAFRWLLLMMKAGPSVLISYARDVHAATLLQHRHLALGCDALSADVRPPK